MMHAPDANPPLKPYNPLTTCAGVTAQVKAPNATPTRLTPAVVWHDAYAGLGLEKHVSGWTSHDLHQSALQSNQTSLFMSLHVIQRFSFQKLSMIKLCQSQLASSFCCCDCG